MSLAVESWWFGSGASAVSAGVFVVLALIATSLNWHRDQDGWARDGFSPVRIVFSGIAGVVLPFVVVGCVGVGVLWVLHRAIGLVARSRPVVSAPPPDPYRIAAQREVDEIAPDEETT